MSSTEGHTDKTPTVRGVMTMKDIKTLLKSLDELEGVMVKKLETIRELRAALKVRLKEEGWL